jgi:two-component system, OmpR family, sensor histidine kinase PhoQ
MPSLKRRLLLAAGAVLAVFVISTGVALDRAFVAAAGQAEQDKLRGLVYALLGAVNITPKQVSLNVAQLGDPRLQQPGSGLYALITDARGRVMWRSPSLLEAPSSPAHMPAAGQWRYGRSTLGGASMFRLGFGVRWTAESGGARYDFVVYEDTHGYQGQLDGYRRTLGFWLGGAAVLLLAALLGVLQWGLRPLRAVSAELERIERGEVERLEGEHPRELRPLVGGLNALLAHERARRERTRHALDDLAHSLKTPLAVLRGLREDEGLGGRAATTVAEQVGRMDQIVAFQLERAVGAGPQGLLPPLPLAPTIDRLLPALERVYGARGIHLRADVTQGLSARIDEHQFMELAGNLLDNAAKWARVRVRLGVRRDAEGLLLWVEDDGPGIDEADAERLQARGARADTQNPGQGIGLAVVAQIAADYGGGVRIARSELGGALVEVRLRTA